MLETTSLTAFLREKLNILGDKSSPKYKFNICTESEFGSSIFGQTHIQGRVRRNSAMTTPMVGLTESSIGCSLELLVPAANGANEHIIAVTSILDALISETNGTYADMDGGRAKIVIDGGIVQGGVAVNGSAGESVILSTTFNVQWTPDVTESTSAITKDQIEIKLLRRTPYHNRIININEPDVEVARFNSTIIGFSHDEVNSTLKLKLPAPFNASYNYIQITEYGGRTTRWFVLSRTFAEPNVWVHTLRRDLVREYWEPISNAESLIERGFLNSSNPLYYKSENISGNLTLGKRSKLVDSNLILAFVKNFQLQNNSGDTDTAVPEGYWRVQGGIPGYGNVPIITDTIPESIRVFDGVNTSSRTAYIFARVFAGTNVFGDDTYGTMDTNGNYSRAGGARGDNLSDNGASCFSGDSPTQSAWNKLYASRTGYAQYVNSVQGLGIQDIPNWMKATDGFGEPNSNVFPTNYECVINKSADVDNPEYYKLVFTRQERMVSQNIDSRDSSIVAAFISATGQAWGRKYNGLAGNDNVVEGNITYYEYTIDKQFLSNTPPDPKNACYTNFPATAVQTTAGAYSYNIFAFKVYDNGVGYKNDYEAMANSGQLIVSALMGTGKGYGDGNHGQEYKPLPETRGDVPSLAGQVVDIQMCPFDESAIHNLIDTVFEIKGNSGEAKVGEYYLLNSQDVEAFIDYDLTDWKSHGNNDKARVSLSQMRLVCPNNSSFSMLNPDIMTSENYIQFKMNGTLYPHKPVYKVTPIAPRNTIYASQDARDNMLVLGGDFSATQVSSAWSDYLIGNKNVEEAQQASIANQTMNQQLQYDHQLKTIQTQSSMSLTASLLGLMGGFAGLNMKEPLAGLMGVTGGAMGLFNTGTNKQLQMEGLQISNTIFNNNIALNQKLFNLQMGNIKAMPNTIHKITNGSFDNDYSVIVEEYYSTNTEYEQFDRAIKRTGMSVNCMGKITDYIEPNYFVFARMIQCVGVENFSIFDEINKELQNGLKILLTTA